MPDLERETRVDAALVARALQADDHAAFAELVLRHQGRVRAQLRQLTRGDHARADDLAQEVFLLAWRKLDQFRGDSRFSTWLFRISYTTFLQSARRRKPEDVLALAESEASHDASHTQALTLDVEAALRQLPDAERVAILHCYHLDLSHEDAAAVLGMPVGTVKTCIARGKARMKTLLSSWDDGRGDSNGPE